MRAPRVFISYSHDSPEHRDNVIDFAQELRRRGIDAQLDAFVESSPPVSWPMWMHHQVRDADYVIVVCSESYKRRAEGDEPDRSSGAAWEGYVITLDLYRRTHNRSLKYVPVIAGPPDEVNIPYFLAGTTHYLMGTKGARDLEPLLRRITKQPSVAPVRLGNIPNLPTGYQREQESREAPPSPGPLLRLGSVVANELLESVANESPTARFVPSGFSDLDCMINGFHVGDVVVIASRPGVGKTALLLNIARNAAALHDARVLLFSPEMTREEIARRFVAAEAGINIVRLRFSPLSTDEEKRAADALSVQQEWQVYIDDSPVLSTSEMREQALGVVRLVGGIDLVMLDYLQLMYEGRGGLSEARAVARALKDLAQEIQASVIVAAQLPRESEEEIFPMPMLSELREAGVLHKEVDVIILLDPYTYAFSDEDDEEGAEDEQNEGTGSSEPIPTLLEGVITLMVVKNRRGLQTGTTHLGFHSGFSRFEDISRFEGMTRKVDLSDERKLLDWIEAAKDWSAE